MNEIKSMWQHNPLAAAMALAGAFMIVMTVFISDYYNIRNTFFSEIVFSGVVVMLTGAWIYIFYSTDKKKPYAKIRRLIHESVKNTHPRPELMEDTVNFEYIKGYIQALSDTNLISNKQSISLQEALRKPTD